MSSLRDLQQRVYRAVVLEEDARLPVGAGTPAQLAARLGVYRNNARATFGRTLSATYPVVERLVGKQCFRSLVLTYVRNHPSRSGDLGHFGDEFAAFLDVCYRDTAFAYLADVARLEWTCALAEAAADAAVLDLLALRGVPAGRYVDLVFTFHPSCQLVSSRFPVLSIWQAHQTEIVSTVSLDTGAEHVLVSRRSGTLCLDRLDAGTFAFARCLAAGESLLEAHEAGLAMRPEFETGRALALLAQLEVFTGVGFGSTP